MVCSRRTRVVLAGLLCSSLGASALLSTAAPAGASALASAPAVASSPAVPRTGDVRVVVQAQDGAAGALRREVRRLGGNVTRALPIVGGFAARLPATAVPRLAAAPGVIGLSEDRAVHVQGGGAATGTAIGPRVLQAPTAWSAGATGEGVTVALVDTGVADSPDLAGRIVPVRDDVTGRTSSCYDLSGAHSCRDTYGHGTFMAGLIAGDGASRGGAPTGAAPGARLLSVKVAGDDGAADVSTVLAAIQWVVSFRQRYGIQVLNLSLGTDSSQPWEDDPLNYAVERAWDAGILVVVAASNRGPGPGSIAKPGDDPWVVTVGAVDDQGTPGTGDDRLPDFSSRGPTVDGVAKPDVVAPGGHVLSLRAPGSTLDREFPPADADSPYRSGSGTSMSAALVSGVAALALQAHPSLSPDRLKHALTASARPVATQDPSAVGAGLVDAGQVASAPAAGAANRGLAHANGRGSLGGSRGSLDLRADDPLGTVLTGRQTAQILLWDAAGFTSGSWTPTTWYTSVNATLGWNTASWDGDFAGSNWTGSNWTGSNWTGSNWTGSNWTGSSWYEEHDESGSYGRSGKGSASYGAWD